MDEKRHTFSVVIPALNEEANIGARINEVRSLRPDAQIIVVDGGSGDRTREIAESSGAIVVITSRGRGRQCNAGALAANGEIVLFLHADTRLPPDAFNVLDRSFKDKDTRIGTFRLKLDLGHHILSFYSACNHFDSVFTRFGDQCITMRRSFFDELGGFPDLPYFEDVELLQKARRSTGIRLFPATVVTSGRRFKEQGVARQYFFDAWLMIRYFFGVPPARLAKEYERFKRNKRGSEA